MRTDNDPYPQAFRLFIAAGYAPVDADRLAGLQCLQMARPERLPTRDELRARAAQAPASFIDLAIRKFWTLDQFLNHYVQFLEARRERLKAKLAAQGVEP